MVFIIIRKEKKLYFRTKNRMAMADRSESGSKDSERVVGIAAAKAKMQWKQRRWKGRGICSGDAVRFAATSRLLAEWEWEFDIRLSVSRRPAESEENGEIRDEGMEAAGLLRFYRKPNLWNRETCWPFILFIYFLEKYGSAGWMWVWHCDCPTRRLTRIAVGLDNWIRIRLQISRIWML